MHPIFEYEQEPAFYRNMNEKRREKKKQLIPSSSSKSYELKHFSTALLTASIYRIRNIHTNQFFFFSKLREKKKYTNQTHFVYLQCACNYISSRCG